MWQEIKPHIVDLRKMLINIVIALIIAFFICFYFYEPILEWIMYPVKEVLPDGSQMVAVEVQETFFTALKVSFLSGFLLSLPIIFWQLWKFFDPALLAHEKRLIVPFVLSATFMFFIGASFAYYIVVPYGFKFLINFGSAVVTVLPSIGKYVTFFNKLIIGFGIAFELPVVTYFFTKIGLLTGQGLLDFSKYAIVIIFVVSAILTPPDVLTQLLMAGPLLLLYGISILIAFNVDTSSEFLDEV